MQDFEIDFSGLNELQEDLKKAVRAYPDKAQETLQKAGKEFKKQVVKRTKDSTDKITGNLLKGYKLDPIKGFGMNMEIDFRSTAPHFHLIENGHAMIANGWNGPVGTSVGEGWIPGFGMAKQTREEYSEVLPRELEKMCEEIFRECGLS